MNTILLHLSKIITILQKVYINLKKPSQIYFITSIVLINTSGYKSNPTIPFMMALNKCFAHTPPTLRQYVML